jgi:hypothetical protein
LLLVCAIQLSDQLKKLQTKPKLKQLTRILWINAKVVYNPKIGKAKITGIGTNKPIPEEVIDEACQNEEYSGAKSISTASQSTTSTWST